MIQRLKRVSVFKRGYASDDKGHFDVPRDTPREECEAKAKELFGSWARVFEEARLPTFDSYGQYVPEDAEVEALNNHGADLIDVVNDLAETYDLTVAEAGRHWQHCEFTRERLDKLNKQIRAAYIEALQRQYRATPRPFDTAKDNS